MWEIDLTTDPSVTLYSWDIVADGNEYTFSEGAENTQGGIKVNIGNANSGFIILTSKVISDDQGCPDAERTDVISFERGYNNAAITGISCVEPGQDYTYTITGTNATTEVDWTLPEGMTIVSADPNATTITVNVSSAIDGGSISASAVEGTCGGDVESLTINSPSDIEAPVVQFSSCLSSNETVWNLGLTPDSEVTYTWDVVSDGYTFSYGDANAPNIGVNVGTATTGTIYLTSVMNQSAGCSEVERIDTFSFERSFDGGSISGLTCVVNGETVEYEITGANPEANITWSLPEGMEIVSADPNALTISVNVISSINGGSILAAVEEGTCGGYIQGLYNVVTAPTLAFVDAPLTNICVSPNSDFQLDVEGIDFYNIDWVSPSGIEGTGYTTFYGNVSNDFVGGVLTAEASRSECPDHTELVSVQVNVDPTGEALSEITANKTCLNAGLSDEVVLTTDAGFQNYNWVLPSGWSISGASNSNVVTVITDGNSGSVSASNECGGTDPVSISLSAEGAGVVTISNVDFATLGVLTIISYDDVNFDHQWYVSGSQPIGNGEQNLILDDASVTPLNYTVQATLISSGCSSLSNTVSSSFAVSARAASTVGSEVNEVSVTPNPAVGVAQIAHYEELNGVRFFVTDMQGSTVYKGVFSNSDTSIDVSNWVNSIYLLNYTHNDEASTIKIQVKN